MFLHGYGADGNDLLGLADPLSPHMPDTLFVAPDAPDRSKMNPMGFQWSPIPWIDGSSEEESRQGLARAAEDLNAFLKVNNYPPFKTRYDYISYEHRQPSFDPSEILVFAPRGEGTVDPAEEAFGEAPA